MKIILVLLIFSNCFAQYYFQNQAITDTFYYAQKTDIFGKSLPSFSFTPSVLMSKNGIAIKRMEENYFIVQKSGTYSFVIYPEPIKKVYPQGEVHVMQTTASIRIFWEDVKPPYILKDDTLVTIAYLNTAAGYSVVNWNDINYFDNMTQDTLGGSCGNDTHFQPGLAAIGDTAYAIWGMHGIPARTRKFYFSNPPNTPTNADSVDNRLDMTYANLTTYGDTIVSVVRGLNETRGNSGYGRAVLKWSKSDFPTVSKAWTITDVTDQYPLIDYFSQLTYNDGSSAYSFGFIRDLRRDSYGVKLLGTSQLLKDLSFVEYRDNYNKIYNLAGDDMTAGTPYDSTGIANNFKIIDTDTFLVSPQGVQKQGDRVYIDYYLESATQPDTLDIWIGYVDLVKRTWTTVKTNLWGLMRIASINLFVDDNYIYLVGVLTQENNTIDYGKCIVYRASKTNPSVFSVYKETESIAFGHQFYNVGGKALFLFYHDYFDSPRELRIKMWREFN